MKTMEDKIKKLQAPLNIKDIDFRVQSLSAKGYVTILAYKDSRVDQHRLDEAVGAMNWKREHTRDNKNCIVSIWCDDKKMWVSKEDTGTESNTEKEKGLASDSFKRTCFNWGVGRELYDYPIIFLQLYPEEYKVFKDNNGKEKATPTFDFKLKKWTWELDVKDGKINLIGKDELGDIRFDSTKDFNSIPRPSKVKGKTQPQQKEQPIKKVESKAEDPKRLPALTEALYKETIKLTDRNAVDKVLESYRMSEKAREGLTIHLMSLDASNQS
jgi:hypothetical protein